jgi:hypothetical protein
MAKWWPFCDARATGFVRLAATRCSVREITQIWAGQIRAHESGLSNEGEISFCTVFRPFPSAYMPMNMLACNTFVFSCTSTHTRFVVPRSGYQEDRSSQDLKEMDRRAGQAHFGIPVKSKI